MKLPIVNIPYSRQELVVMMENCSAYKGSTAEAYEEFQEMCKFENWSDLTVFTDKACVFYEATPKIFRGLLLLYIACCFETEGQNQNTSDAILFDFFYKKNSSSLSEFTEKELEIVHRWVAWLVVSSQYRFEYSPEEMLQVYTSLLNAQAQAMKT